MDKTAKLLELAKLRQRTRWAGHFCLGDFHGGAYDCDFVSPYTKTAGNVDADVFVMLQDWASEDRLKKGLTPEIVEKGHDPLLPANIKLSELLQDTFGLKLSDVYGTNLFPLIKPGPMDSPISDRDMVRAAREFGWPQIEIVTPKLVVCLGLATFNGLRRAVGLPKAATVDSAIKSPFNAGNVRVWCQGHTGRRGQDARNKSDPRQMEKDWQVMKADVEAR